MKRIIYFILTIPFFLRGAIINEEVTVDGYSVCLYEAENASSSPQAMLIGISENRLEEARKSLHLILPDYVTYDGEDYYLTRIASDVFSGRNLEAIEEITLPEGLTFIFHSNFYQMPGLKKINSGDKVSAIGQNNFSDMPLLEEINFPYIDIITTGSFCNIGIRSLRLEKCVGTLSGAIYANENGNSWRRKGTACSHMPNLAELDLGTIITITDNSFNNLPNLSSVTIPSSCEKLGAYTFSAMEHLTEVKFATRGKKSISISFQAFAECLCLKTFM